MNKSLSTIVVLSVLFIIFLFRINSIHETEIREWEQKTDSLTTVISELDSRLAQNTNRLVYWEQYAKSHQYGSQIERCKLICNNYCP